jgi:hypothetical protein
MQNAECGMKEHGFPLHSALRNLLSCLSLPFLSSFIFAPLFFQLAFSFFLKLAAFAL